MLSFSPVLMSSAAPAASSVVVAPPSADAQDDIERVQGEIPEVNNKITQVEGEMKACINNAEKLRLQSRLERVKNAEA